MPEVSVIIPTHNRPGMLKRSLISVLNQTYRDFEAIVVDDGVEQRSESVVRELNDSRIRYISHDQRKGGAAARNTGIRAAKGGFIAFLDDDDEWLPEKLAVQMAEFEPTPAEVGFSFTAVTNVTEGGEFSTRVPAGVGDYHELALEDLKAFLTVTLIIKKSVFDSVGMFDETLPSHQEIDLMIRVTAKYLGLGVDRPLVRVDMTPHGSVGQDLKKRIAGRVILLQKHRTEFEKRPALLARHYFLLGLLYRDDGQFAMARKNFSDAFRIDPSPRYLAHRASLMFGAAGYRILKRFRSK